MATTDFINPPPEAAAPPTSGPRRIVSIDALRGLVMFTMIFVNDLAGNDIVLDWMVHYSDRHHAEKAWEQCQPIDPDIRIGLTPDIGQNDEKSEVFSLADAEALEKWAKQHPWVCSLSFWCSNRDTGQPKAWDHGSGVPQKPWAFTKIFRNSAGPAGGNGILDDLQSSPLIPRRRQHAFHRHR